jgi:copper(I)-binding protein
MAAAMKITVSILAALLAMSLNACDSASSTICVTDSSPWIRLPTVPGRPGAGYFQIPSQPDQGDLLSVSSPRIARIEMHESTTSAGVTSMHRIDRIATNECQRFATSEGRHLMLFGVDPELRAGNQVQLVFHFERGSPETFAAIVMAAGEEHPH